MRSIQRRFSNLQEKRPRLSSVMNFGTAVSGQGFSKEMIYRWFGKLVEKEDYEGRDKRAILQHLVLLSNPVRTTGNRA
jgi:hypothetical protein